MDSDNATKSTSIPETPGRASPVAVRIPSTTVDAMTSEERKEFGEHPDSPASERSSEEDFKEGGFGWFVASGPTGCDRC
jgi:hypothetical protein